MLDLTESTFKNEVLQDQGVVLVDFWAPWCGPCKMVAPVLEEIAAEKKDQLKVVKVNVDENPGLASSYKVMSIPSMLVFKKGELVEEFNGALSKGALEEKLGRWLH